MVGNQVLFPVDAYLIHSHADPRYVSRKYYESNPELKKAIDQIHDGFFSPDEKDLFHDLTYQLLNHDT
jgi:glucan phosphorylase